MKPSISSKLVFRVPKFSWKASLASCWEELKVDISLASPPFYDLIKDTPFDEVEKLSKKEQFTIWKYFNRARFRATPFGTFGGFGIAQSKPMATGPIKLGGKFKQQRFVNWPKKHEALKTVSEILSGDPYLFSNSSYYLNGTYAIRFVTIEDKEFGLTEVGYNTMVLRILDAAKSRIKKSDLLQTLNCVGKEREETEDLIKDMLLVQLLMSDDEPNIIGEDFFRRTGTEHIEDRTPYVICEADVNNAEMDFSKFKHIPALIDLLHRHSRVRSNATLETFKARFLKKFDREEVPLMMALDPEMGVGYDALEHTRVSSYFALELKNKPRKKPEGNDALKIKLTEVFAGKSLLPTEIDIETFFGAEAKALHNLPNSLSVILQMVDDLVYIEQIGGATANALCGRFTLGSENMLALSRETAKKEADANPGVIFFDVAYMGEANVDNINRRASIYDYQLSILNYDLSKYPLFLNDILISIRGEEIVLRSEKLNTRLVPRIATAYNYSRSDLSLFRLMCDLQHQNLHSYLLPDVVNWFPDHHTYPRLRYKNIIVSPQKWKIFKKEIPKEVNELQAFLEDRKVSRQFRCGLSDQLLCFDRGNLADLEAFLQYASKMDHLMLEEFHESGQASVVDKNNAPLISQFILNAFHEEKVYAPISGKNASITESKTVRSFYSPGSEWLYFEIYCHPQRTNSLLTGPISAVLHDVRALIENWFFIRYDENGDHLRLRFKLRDLNQFQPVVESLYKHLQAWIDMGLVSDLQIKTYKRELARYGAHLIDEVEKHFGIDSALVQQELLERDEDLKYIYAISAAKKILKSHFDAATMLKLVQDITDSFSREHHLEAGDFKALNKQYADFSKNRREAPPVESFLSFQTSFVNLLKSAEDRSRTLFADLFHMHVNRMFYDLQRTHELIIYYYLLKDLQRERAMSG